jgi:hypothetical protein
MHPKNFYEPAYFADQPSFHDRPLPFDPSPQEATFQLTRRAALIVVLALSLGLWAVIWAALASLASAALG